MQYYLTFIHPEENYADPTWFGLGTGFHTVVEEVVEDDLDLDQALWSGQLEIELWLEATEKRGRFESPSNKAKRTLESMPEDMDRMIRKWFRDVHPDSDKRLGLYDDYDWPPKVEHIIDTQLEGTSGLRTTVDAIFTGGPRGRKTAIVDWKTGANPKAADVQIQVYAWGLKQEGLMSPTQNRSLGWFHHVDHGKLQKVSSYWGEMIPELIRKTEREKREIQATGKVLATPDWFCGYCPVKALCPLKGKGEWQPIQELLVDTIEWRSES
jgi:hypothetical protein